jgi:hypothetical protein
MTFKTTVLPTKALLAVSLLVYFSAMVNAQTVYKYAENANNDGYRITNQSNNNITINYSISQVKLEERKIDDGSTVQNVSLASGVFLPNEAGSPDLPSNTKYIAIPQGAKPTIKIISVSTETIRNVEVAPAPVIPKDEIDKIGVPLVYEKNNAIYSKNELYPATPVALVEQLQIRGVDVVELGIMPFQYNPITKDLIVYKNIQVEINFDGGNGHFGNDAYRSRWWDPILEDVIFNYNQLPKIDYNEQIQKAIASRATGCEYAIIIPNGADYTQWADSIKKFRREQGVLTDVYKLSDIGSTTVSGIETWVNNAYNTWTIKPAAMLILGDYGTDANSTVISSKTPGFACDNQYADVTGDNLPEIAFARIMANNATQLKTMCSKFLEYERNPPTDPSFYDKPVSAVGWQDDRWYQLGVEIVTGFMKSIGKHPVRINSPSSPASNTGGNTAGSGNWSTTSATTVINYFGDNGLKYIPDKPGTLGGFTGGTATMINSAINSGAFIAYHRDHGQYSGWYKPSYQSSNVASLTNVDSKFPFVFSVNCNTGEYQTGSACFSESIHRHTYSSKNSGALGVIAPSEVSYSFVNDIFLWGIMDNMWPNFMPAMGTSPPSRDMRPTFAAVAGRYFLKQSSWYSSGSSKTATYQLYHTFSEAFQWFYSEVPQKLTVTHNSTVAPNATTFDVTADAGSFIALTIPSSTGPIILGTATGTGSAVSIPLSQAPTGGAMLVTVTKQNYFRYGGTVNTGAVSVDDNINNNILSLSCYPNPFSQAATITYSLDKSTHVTLAIYDMLGKEVISILNNIEQAGGKHEVQLSSKDLAPGVYSCVLKTGAHTSTKSLVVSENK